MGHYPINLDICGRPCLVVGGGGVGTRKVQGLLECGANVTLVSPRATPQLQELARCCRITWHCRPYVSTDMDGRFLVMGATDDEALNRQVHADALARGVLCNIADRPPLCQFILPAVVRRGDLVISVSTSGKSPAMAKRLRRQLQAQFGPEYAATLRLLGAVRGQLLANDHAPEAHKGIFEHLIEAGIVDLVGQDKQAQIEALLRSVMAPEQAAAALAAWKEEPNDAP